MYRKEFKQFKTMSGLTGVKITSCLWEVEVTNHIKISCDNNQKNHNILKGFLKTGNKIEEFQESLVCWIDSATLISWLEKQVDGTAEWFERLRNEFSPMDIIKKKGKTAVHILFSTENYRTQFLKFFPSIISTLTYTLNGNPVYEVRIEETILAEDFTRLKKNKDFLAILLALIRENTGIEPATLMLIDFEKVQIRFKSPDELDLFVELIPHPLDGSKERIHIEKSITHLNQALGIQGLFQETRQESSPVQKCYARCSL